jgi:hypothetical protein
MQGPPQDSAPTAAEQLPQHTDGQVRCHDDRGGADPLGNRHLEAQYLSQPADMSHYVNHHSDREGLIGRCFTG